MIQEEIEAKVTAMDANSDTFTFLHGETEWQNLRADEFVFPAVFLDMPVKYKPVIVSSGAWKAQFVLVALFLYKSELDNNEGQRYDSLKKAMEAQRQFQLLIEQDSDTFEGLTVGECYQVQNIFDANLDGVVMPFAVTLRNTNTVCQ